jgi:D-sedoheptulose 7-phosphate isomerase
MEFDIKLAQIRDLHLNENSFNKTNIESLADDIQRVFKLGNKIAFVGNGGSAAEAMHLAAEFTGRCLIDHKPFAALCLNESQSALTAIANDYGIDQMFSRMVEAHLVQGDILIALTTSGRSKNILSAVEKAKEKGIRTIVWMGDYDFSVPEVETWKVPSTVTPRIQEIHLAWGHLVAELVEISLEKSK